jgi:hypothetical protein
MLERGDRARHVGPVIPLVGHAYDICSIFVYLAPSPGPGAPECRRGQQRDKARVSLTNRTSKPLSIPLARAAL